MSRVPFRCLTVGALGFAGLALAACGGGASTTTGGAGHAATTRVSSAVGTPVAGQKRGGTLTVLAAGDVDNIDPGQAYYSFTYQVLNATARTLYAVKPTNDGSDPTPDLAAGPPKISADKKTITVKLKPGIRYSPPYDKVVTSADVKYAIERAFTPAVPNGYVNSYFSNIDGVAAFKSGKAKDISGIQTPDPSTIVFHISGGDLVGALVLPVTSPVPEAYAKRYDEAKGQSTYGQHQLAEGPYMIKSYAPGRSIVLVRNPSWDAKTDFRPAYLDSITVQEGNQNTEVATRRVLDGTSLTTGDFAPPPDLIASAVAKKQNIVFAPGAGNEFLGINTTIKPLDNVNVRRAIAAVLDRTQLQKVSGGVRTGDIATHFLYPTLEGFDQAGGTGTSFDFLQHPKGDLALAERYMKKAGYPSGRYTGSDKLLMVGANEGNPQRWAQVINQNITQLGFKVNLRLVSQETMYTKFCQVPKARVAFCPSLGWNKDYADPRTVLDPLFNPANIQAAGNSNFSQDRGDDLGPEFARAAALPGGPARIQAYANLDKKITGLALGVPYQWSRFPVAASKNVQMVNMLWNQGVVDLTYTSLK